MGAAIAMLMMAAPAVAGAADDLKLPRQKVERIRPASWSTPHEQATKAGPKIVEFKMTIQEKEVVIDAAGTKFHANDVRRIDARSDDGGPRGRLHGSSRWSTPRPTAMPHNIDLHSATGALGGGALTHVNPGEQVVLRWKATRLGRLSSITAPRKA